MAEPKILPAIMRKPKRYIAFEVISEGPIEYGDLVQAVWNSMLEFLGELETSAATTWVMKTVYQDETQKGLVKCDHQSIEKIRSSLALIQYIGETKVIIKILGVTGTIKSAKTKYLNTENSK